MKNNFLISVILVFIFSFSFDNKVKSEELQFNANEIQSLEKGNKIIASNGVEIKGTKGIVIKADNAEYDKIQSVIKIKDNVKINDSINNNILTTNKAIYFVKEDKIISKDETIIEVEEKYIIVTSNITYDRKLKEIFSENQTTIQDNSNNILNANNFKLLINDKILEAKFINLIDSDSNEHNIEIAKLNLETNEIIGKDLSINFNKKYFSENNDPRLKAKSIIIEKENSFFKKGIFTTCKKRGDKCPPWTVSAEEIHHDKKKKNNKL